mmetsp:Transcript_8526/g.17324  ORF Transcript_8526/g.17324 Transcript_8526/m.17324 type:complete len:216 (+) Transcript_8526:118-765(+)
MADLALQSTTQSTIPPGYQLDIQPTPTQTAASLNRVVIDIQGGRNVINDNLNEVGGQFDLGGGTGVREFMAPAQRRVATTSVWGGNGQCRQLQTSTGELPSLALQKVATFCMNAYPSDSGDDDSSGAPSVAPVAVGSGIHVVDAVQVVEAVQKAEDLAAQQSSPPPLSASAGGASAASDGRQHHSLDRCVLLYYSAFCWLLVLGFGVTMLDRANQ